MATATGPEPVTVITSFVATLTYTGKSASNIKIAYREFSGENDRRRARTAFYLDLEYDLEESAIIAFRDIHIEVIEATSSNIHFRVLDDGGLEWLPPV